MLGEPQSVAAWAGSRMTAMVIWCGSVRWIRSRQCFLTGGHVL